MATTKTNTQIQQDVLNELKWDTRLSLAEIGVSVHGGAVTLTGTVTSYAKRIAAADAAHRVSGVLDVANDIVVKLPGSAERTDGEIAEAVRRALEWDVFVPDRRIQSTVSKGLVTLIGEVDHSWERDEASRAIRNLAGVRAVVNDIKLHTPKVAKQDVAAAIKKALERRADREADHIALDVSDGMVTLTGKVHTWADREAAIGAAWGTRGVGMVVDHLRIEP